VVDIAARTRLYQRAFALIRDDAPWLFLYAPRAAWAVGDRFAAALPDWRPGDDGIIRFD
jgi:hypothetical protein